VTVLVFNCAYNGLNIIQELGRRGVDVHALDSFRNVGTTSRYATYHSCPNPTSDEEAFIEYLLDLESEFDDEPVLIPTNDHWAAAIANHRERLAEHYRPCVADGETVDLLLDKRAFGDWAEQRDHPVPRSWEGEEVREVPDDAFPVAAKPGDARDAPDMMYRSKLIRTIDKIFGTDAGNPDEDPEELGEKAQLYQDLRLEVLEDRAELEEFVETYPEIADEFVYQEYVRGMSDEMYTVGVYADEGEVEGLFTGRKVRGYPPDIGDCKVGQAESVPDRLVETTREMARDLGYHGIAEFEFKRDAETGAFYLIEVNPRSWSWVGITPACGVSLPWMAYADHAGIEEFSYTEADVPDGSVKWVKAFEDLANCLVFYRDTHPEWTQSPSEWWESVRADDLVVAEVSLDDPLPIGYSVAVLGRHVVKETKSRVVDRLGP